MAEDWVRNAHNKFDAKAQSRHEVEKALGTANHKKMQLAKKLKAVENACQSAEAGLKTTDAQAKDQCKQLYATQINLAIEKAAVLDLKAELQKAQETLKVAMETAKAAKAAAYKCRVMETETRLTAEVTVVCRDYCTETYYNALNQAGVPADSDLRRADKVYYPEDIGEDPTALPPPAALPLPPLEQPLTTRDPSQGIEILARIQKEKRGDVGVFRPTKKAKDKGVQPPTDANPSEDTLTIGDMVSRLKLLNPSPRLTPKKILINCRPRYRVLALFFAIFVMALCFQM